jgi:CPA2 family monovalent cation:H+ antiporter-2
VGEIVAEHSVIFRDIAMVFAAALVCGLVAWRIKQPILLGYVLAGLIVSPLTPGLRVHDVHVFELMAEVGVVLLMFSVGIHFSIPDLMKVKWVALIGSPLGVVLSVVLCMGVGWLMHWPVLQSLAVGCIVAVASTMVLMRLLMDRGEMNTEAGRVMIALTLVEDLVVVILTVLLPSLVSEGGADYGQVAWRIGKAFLLLIPIAAAAWKLMPRLLARVEKTCNDEISLLLALTTCMVVAAVTEAVGLSLALGAFLGGMLLGSSAFVKKLEHQTAPLRDAFVAVFFVSVGMLIDPRTWGSAWQIILLLVGLVLAGKFVTWFGVVKLFGYTTSTSARVAIGLTQIGEFSFILAQVSQKAGLITPAIYNATLVASLVTILVNAMLFKIFLKQEGPLAPGSKEATT